MQRTTAAVIGAGQAGLAMSHCLGRHGIDHVVLERGRVAERWRSERWDSLRLLTPNWCTRLPGWRYRGDDPDGFMTMPEIIGYLEDYAHSFAAPVRTGVTVTEVRPDGAGWRVATDHGAWRARAVVIATGHCDVPCVPGMAQSLPTGIRQVTPSGYRNPGQLPDGGVLIVGASATGLQLADEIQKSGRPVTLAVGEHVRMPRTYRGRDIQYWMLKTGVLDQRIEEVDEPERARRVPSPQLAGTPDRSTLDLNALTARGVGIVGKLAGLRDGKAQFSGSLRNACTLADLKMNRLLAGIDDWIAANGLDRETGPIERFAPTAVAKSPRLALGLDGRDVRTIVWATGFRPDYTWLDLPVFDRKGRLQHDRGIVAAPGVYVLGLPYLRRRKSSFIHGAGDDVRELGSHLAAYLDRTVPVRVTGIAV